MLGYGSILWEICIRPSVERHSLGFINRMLKWDLSLFFPGSSLIPGLTIFFSLSSLHVSRGLKVILDDFLFFKNIFQSITKCYQFNLQKTYNCSPHHFYIALSWPFVYLAAALVPHGIMICLPNSMFSECSIAFQK